MSSDLLLTLTLEGAAEASAEERQAVDGFVAGLVADLNSIEAVSASALISDEVEPGSKALSPLLLGALTAEVNGEMVAIKVLRFLFSRLVEQPLPTQLPIQLKVSRKGSEVSVEMKCSPGDSEAAESLLAQASDVVRRLS